MIQGRENKERIEGVRRIYNSLRYFVGENQIYPPGDILCVSTKNNDRYDLFLQADGKSNFRTLYNGNATFPQGGAGSSVITLQEEDDGQTLRMIVKE